MAPRSAKLVRTRYAEALAFAASTHECAAVGNSHRESQCQDWKQAHSLEPAVRPTKNRLPAPVQRFQNTRFLCTIGIFLNFWLLPELLYAHMHAKSVHARTSARAQ
eukprot:2387347-Pleurochrysis_carterae.AAC.1